MGGVVSRVAARAVVLGVLGFAAGVGLGLLLREPPVVGAALVAPGGQSDRSGPGWTLAVR